MARAVRPFATHHKGPARQSRVHRSSERFARRQDVAAERLHPGLVLHCIVRNHLTRPPFFTHGGARCQMTVSQRCSRTMCMTSTWTTNLLNSASGTRPVCARPPLVSPMSHAGSSLQSVHRPGRVRPLAFSKLCGNTCHHALFLGTSPSLPANPVRVYDRRPQADNPTSLENVESKVRSQ